MKIYRRVVGNNGNSESGAGGDGRIIESEGNNSASTSAPSARKEFSYHGVSESKTNLGVDEVMN